MPDSKPPPPPAARTTMLGTGWEKDVWTSGEPPNDQSAGSRAAGTEVSARPAPPARPLPPPPSRPVPAPSRAPLPPLPPLPPPPPIRAEPAGEPPVDQPQSEPADGDGGPPHYGSAPEVLEVEPDCSIESEPNAPEPAAGPLAGSPNPPDPAVPRERPRWLIAAGLSAGSLLAGVLVGLVLAGNTTPAAPAPPARSVSVAAAPAASASGSTVAHPPQEPPAGSADVARIEAKAAGERTVDEVLSLARSQRAARAGELEQLSAKLQGPEAEHPAVWKALRDFVYDSATSAEALGAAARVSSPAGADFLYRLWSSSARKTPVTELTDSLLSTKEVHGRASPALRLVLDLRQAKSCEDYLPLLDRAIESGDRRALPSLGKLMAKQGCGPSKRDDCFACLREGDKLKDALKAIRSRPGPRIP